MLVAITGCSIRERLSSKQAAVARANPVLQIEKHITTIVRSSGDWEMAQFRKYHQEDVDGDGIDDALLLTTFEHGLIWHRKLFVSLSSSPDRVMQLTLAVRESVWLKILKLKAEPSS